MAAKSTDNFTQLIGIGVCWKKTGVKYCCCWFHCEFFSNFLFHVDTNVVVVNRKVFNACFPVLRTRLPVKSEVFANSSDSVLSLIAFFRPISDIHCSYVSQLELHPHIIFGLPILGRINSFVVGLVCLTWAFHWGTLIDPVHFTEPRWGLLCQQVYCVQSAPVSVQYSFWDGHCFRWYAASQLCLIVVNHNNLFVE